MIKKDHQFIIQEIDNDLEIKNYSAHTTFLDNLGMCKVAVKSVLIVQVMLEYGKCDPDFLTTVITDDECWVSRYDLETNTKGHSGDLQHSPRQRKQDR